MNALSGAPTSPHSTHHRAVWPLHSPVAAPPRRHHWRGHQVVLSTGRAPNGAATIVISPSPTSQQPNPNRALIGGRASCTRRSLQKAKLARYKISTAFTKIYGCTGPPRPGDNHSGLELPLPGLMSLTITVPTSVPSLFHNSQPWIASSIAKKNESPITVSQRG